jgi:hypothetical protein
MQTKGECKSDQGLLVNGCYQYANRPETELSFLLLQPLLKKRTSNYGEME